MAATVTDIEREVLTELHRAGPAVAVERMLAMPPRDALEACAAVIVRLARQERRIADAILLGWSGAVHAQALARQAPQLHGLDRELLDRARGLFFTLGSLLWPGWGEADAALDETARQVAVACSERALALAEAIEAPPVLRSRAHWLVGVHALFSGEAERARMELVAAGRWADRAGATQEVRLLRGYLLMAQATAAPSDPEVLYELERLCSALEDDPDAAAFGRQLRVAWSSLAPDRPLPEAAAKRAVAVQAGS